MKKSTLLKIPICKAKTEDIGLAKRIEDALCFAHASLAEVDEEESLILSFYDKEFLLANELMPLFRIFINQSDYLAYNYREKKWLTSSIDNLIRNTYNTWNWANKVITIDNESDDEIRNFVNCQQGNVFLAIKDIQESIRSIRLSLKHEKLKNKIDERMKLIPELPKDFQDWINNTVLLKSRYIYYARKIGKNKPVAAFCTNCKTDLMVENPVHNKEGKCPNCKSQIIFKSIGRSTKVVDNEQLAIMQKVDGGLVTRYFAVARVFGNHYRNPETKLNEIVRFFNFEKKEEVYEWNYFKQTDEIRWTDTGSKYTHNYDTYVYTKNISRVIKNTPFKYSAIKEYSNFNNQFIPFDYFRTYKRYPFIEYLIKLKLFNLAETVLCRGYSSEMNLKGKTLQEILKVSKKNIPLLQELNATTRILKIIQYMEEHNIKIPAERIKYIEESFRDPETLFKSTKYSSINKIIKYLEKQKDSDNPLETQSLNSIYQLWEDYLRFCKELNYDLKNEFIFFPKHLEAKHDETHIVLKEKRRMERERIESERRQKMIDMYPTLKEKYTFEYKDLIIIPPKNADELIKEGQDLSHCVDSYTDKIADGTSIILFIREKDNPSTSYATLDIRKNEIYQCRGYKNKDLSEQLEDLLNKFKNDKLKVEVASTAA